MTEPGQPPSAAQVAAWLGKDAAACWREMAGAIDKRYPGGFAPEWLYGGKKHGWSLRCKKSRPLCTFVPEKGCFLLLIVFGAEERAKVEAMRDALPAWVRKAYDAATTYHDGKWLLLDMSAKDSVATASRLLTVKRKAKDTP